MPNVSDRLAMERKPEMQEGPRDKKEIKNDVTRNQREIEADCEEAADCCGVKGGRER